MTVDRSVLPIPTLDKRNMPFLAGARAHTFLLPKCSDCGNLMAPPVANCTSCLSDSVTWQESSGLGNVFSFIEYHRAWVASFSPFIPYNVSIIALDEGPRLISNVLVKEGQKLEVGARVKVAFEQRGESDVVPVFVLSEE